WERPASPSSICLTPARSRAKLFPTYLPNAYLDEECTMRTPQFLALFAAALLSPGLLIGERSSAVLAQTKGKADPAFAPVKDDPALPRVLLIGDSISIGYTVPARKLLQGKANVHRIPENGGPTSNGSAKLDKWLGDGKWDVIHFNWGLHDLK